MTVIAGTGEPDNLDGINHEETFNRQQGKAIDKSGNIYVADRGNNKIREILINGTVITIVGNGAFG
ncbi:MAG: hypothetical protein H7096_02915 [Flavobacterium sp.]|nr:hypothetical protein [Pedobacter sp.]